MTCAVAVMDVCPQELRGQASSVLEFFSQRLGLPQEASERPEVFRRHFRTMQSHSRRIVLVVEDCDRCPTVELPELEGFLMDLSSFAGDSLVLLLTYTNAAEAIHGQVRC